jgi:hypothetical protein
MSAPTKRNSRAETHRKAIDAVLGLLEARGFGYDPFGYKRGEKIRVTSYQGRPLAVPFVNLEVHASNEPMWFDVLAPDVKPVEDAKELVVICWLMQPYLPQFLFLANNEAAQRWHMSGERGFYGTHADKPDPDGVLKILGVGKSE